MKKIVTVTEVEGEGLLALIGKNVMLFCLNYIYTGTLAGVNTNDVLLENAAIVYETGAFDKTSFDDKQNLPFNHYIRISAIESYCETNKKCYMTLRGQKNKWRRWSGSGSRSESR